MPDVERIFDNLGYRGTRRVLIVVGIVVLVALTAGMALRDVESAETVAVALFIPVFLACVAFDIAGGLIAAIAATVVYIVMRRDAIDAVGVGRFIGLIASRGLAFIVFGLLGGIANRLLRLSLVKLNLLDTMDIRTNLYNARFFVDAAGNEIVRANRYDSEFSVAMLDVPAAPIEAMNRKRRSEVLLELGKMLTGGARTIDRVAIAYDRDRYRIAAILPETDQSGAEIFASRMADRVGVSLFGRGVAVPPDSVRTITFPRDRDALEALRIDFAVVDVSARPLEGSRFRRS